MQKVIILVLISCVTCTLSAAVYTLGSDASSTVQSWDSSFTELSSVTAWNVAGTRQVIAVGDLNESNAGNEIVWGRTDGYGIVTNSINGSRVTSGAVLNFSSVSAAHLGAYGYLDLAVLDVFSAYEGNEIVTVAGDNVLEIWDYSDTGLGSRLHVCVLDNMTTATIADVTFGEFDSSNEGLEMAILRTDGYVGIFPILATNSYYRLSIFNAANASQHEPFDLFFSGALDPSLNGDAIATVGTDGYLEVYNPETGLRNSSLTTDISSISTKEPFLDITADHYIPEPATMILCVLSGLMAIRRRSKI